MQIVANQLLFFSNNLENMMAINLTHAVIHSFTKEANTQVVTDVVKKDDLLDVQLPAVVTLVDGVASLIGKKGNSVTYGQFGDDMRQGPFPSAFENYHRGPTDEEFLTMTHVAVDQLAQQAAEQILSTGGHILVARYESNAIEFVLIAMIKQRGGVTLDANLVPIGIIEVDLSKVNQAARINLNAYNVNIEAVDDLEVDKTYLSFLGQNTETGASAYFVKALGCTKGITSSRATSAVLSGVQEFFQSSQELKPFRHKARDAVIAYMHNALERGGLIRLDDLVHEAGRVLPAETIDQAVGLYEFLNGERIRVPDTFKVNEGTLKRRSRLKEDDTQWAIQFEQGLLGDTPQAKIYFNRDEQTLTINNLRPEFVEKIKTELDSR